MSMTVKKNERCWRLLPFLLALFVAVPFIYPQTGSAGAVKAGKGSDSAVTGSSPESSSGAPHTGIISLDEMAKKIGADVFFDPLSGAVTLMKNGHLANFRTGEQLVLFDYRECALLDAPRQESGGVFLTSAFSSRMESFFDTLPPPVSYRVGAILIDPGHGGKDPGAIGKTTVNGRTVDVREKDVVLSVAKDLYAKLSAKYPDKKILLTRTGDTYPSLEDRVDMANSVKLEPHEAILYISVHANSAFNKDSTGFEVWYLSSGYRRTVIDKGGDESSEILPILNSMMEEEFTTESILIAKSIMDELDRRIGKQSPNRGIKEESWFVVRNARMPSVLVELGFVSNPEEVRLLSDNDYLQKCSAGIYNGLVVFISHFEGSRGFTSIQ